MRLDDGAVHARRKSEVIGIDDQLPHFASLAGTSRGAGVQFSRRLMRILRQRFSASALGARQESDGSCGRLFGSAFPEVLKATTELGTGESDDGVGAMNGPVHPGAFEPRADSHLAPSLDNTGGSAQALRMELRIAHAVSVSLEIMEAAAGLLRTRYLAPEGGE